MRLFYERNCLEDKQNLGKLKLWKESFQEVIIGETGTEARTLLGREGQKIKESVKLDDMGWTISILISWKPYFSSHQY